MSKHNLVKVDAALHWKSEGVHHTDCYFFSKINLWRDIFPGLLGDQLATMQPGESARWDIEPGEAVPAWQQANVYQIKQSQFNRQPTPMLTVIPFVGRHYPANLLTGMQHLFKEDRRPFRVLEQDDESLTIDLNHPFTRFAGELEVMLAEVIDNEKEERGGRCNDICETLIGNGVGMQAQYADKDVDFFSGTPFECMDSREDSLFYETQRMVNHSDDAAQRRLKQRYRDFVQPGMQVLDLMASWNSHIPDDIEDVTVTGLGMNQQELDANPLLNKTIVRDLNQQPELPFDDQQFDLVICSLSVEYLKQPFAVFKEVKRILKPGGIFLCSWSERWFPTKVIILWEQLHPFERISVVLEYFKAAGFTDLHTETIRGLPRDDQDTTFDTALTADPLFLVWGGA